MHTVLWPFLDRARTSTMKHMLPGICFALALVVGLGAAQAESAKKRTEVSYASPPEWLYLGSVHQSRADAYLEVPFQRWPLSRKEAEKSPSEILKIADQQISIPYCAFDSELFLHKSDSSLVPLFHSQALYTVLVGGQTVQTHALPGTPCLLAEKLWLAVSLPVPSSLGNRVALVAPNHAIRNRPRLTYPVNIPPQASLIRNVKEHLEASLVMDYLRHISEEDVAGEMAGVFGGSEQAIRDTVSELDAGSFKVFPIRIGNRSMKVVTVNGSGQVDFSGMYLVSRGGRILSTPFHPELGVYGHTKKIQIEHVIFGSDGPPWLIVRDEGPSTDQARWLLWWDGKHPSPRSRVLMSQ